VEPTLLEFLPSVALAIALASCAGLRAFLPLLLTAAVARAGYLELGPGFQFLASDRALVLFGLAAFLEFLGDKIPAVDHALDMLGTLLRPAAGALLAASVMWRVDDPLVALVLGLVVGAPAALVPHAAKSTLRTVSTTLTAGLANPLISLLEDAISLGMFALAVLVPLLVASLVLLTAFWLLRRLRARARRPATAT
jgi:hypothetical protein